MNVRLVDDVYLDLRSARDWCDEKRDGLGDEFGDLFFAIAQLFIVSSHYPNN